MMRSSSLSVNRRRTRTPTGFRRYPFDQALRIVAR